MKTAPKPRFATRFMRVLFWIYWAGVLSTPFGFYWASPAFEHIFVQGGLLVLFMELLSAIGLCFSSAILVKSDPRLAQLGLITLGLVFIILFIMILRGVTLE